MGNKFANRKASREPVSFRFRPELVKALDVLAEAYGLNRTQAAEAILLNDEDVKETLETLAKHQRVREAMRANA